MPSSNFLFDFDEETAPQSYVNRVEMAVKVSGIIDARRAGSEVGQQSREFIPQPDLGEIGGTRESFVAKIQEYESSIDFTQKQGLAVASWPFNRAPEGNLYRSHLNKALLGQSWGVHMDPSKKSSGIAGYGRDEADPASALCQYKYIIWDSTFGPDYISGPGLCGSVVLRRRQNWITLYSRITAAMNPGRGRVYIPEEDNLLDVFHEKNSKWEKDPSLRRHNAMFIRDDMEDVPAKVEKLEQDIMPGYAMNVAANQARLLRMRYLTRAAAACYWRTLVRVYGEVYTSIRYRRPA